MRIKAMKYILSVYFLIISLQCVHGMENIPESTGNFCLGNGLSIPIPAGETIFQARSGGISFSAIFQGVVDGQRVDIILTSIDNFNYEDMKNSNAYIEDGIKELRAEDSTLRVKATILKHEVDNMVPEHGSLMIITECLIMYSESGPQIPIYAGIISSRAGTVFFEALPSTDFSSLLYPFIDNWAEQVAQKMEKHSECSEDDSNFSKSAPFLRTGQTLKDFRIPLPDLIDQNHIILSEDDSSMQLQGNDCRVDKLLVSLLSDDTPYDSYMYEKGLLARRMSTRDSTGIIYNIYPQKVYESRYIGCSSWYDPHSIGGATNVFFGMAYLDGRVLSIQITGPNRSIISDIGIEWITSIFCDNSEMADVLFYDVRKELTE